MPPDDPYSKYTQSGSRPVAVPVVPAVANRFTLNPIVVVGGVAGLLVIAALAFLLTRGGAGASPADIQLKFPAGATLKYKLHATQKSTTTVGGAPAPQSLAMDFDGGLLIKVDSVSGGKATLSYRLDKVVEKSNGKVQATQTTASAKPPLVLEVDHAGAVTVKDENIESGTDGTNTIPGQELLWPLLADRAVSPGATWSNKQEEAVPLLGKFDYTAQTRLLRYENVGGTRTAVLQTTASAPLKIGFEGTFKLDRTAWVDPATGSLRQSKGTAEFDLHSGQAGAGLQRFDTVETWDVTAAP
jgi:hypothetical protein